MIGNEILSFARDLWPINRSLTGEGVRQTLSIIKAMLPDLNIHSVPTGTSVFDWTVPREWKVNCAYIITPDGEKICDFAENNLHLVGYSTPFKGKLSLGELQHHLYSLPEQPNAIPYVTSYYKERWGFCLSHEQRESLKAGDYEVVIDSELFDGVLNYAELIIPGKCEQEVFISTYVCHPSMANNELSGPSVVAFLAKWLKEQRNREYTYRIIFIPETIGSITYLSRHLKELKKHVVAGFNVTCVGDNRAYSYLPSRQGNTLSDTVAKHVLKWVAPDYACYSWLERGSDERQYCAPGVDLPMASIMRTKYGEYPEYHTSLDDFDHVVNPEGLEGGYNALQKALQLLENNKTYTMRVLCEPQLGKRGLYPSLSTRESGAQVRNLMNFISYCDGNHAVLDIAEIINVPAWELYDIANTLLSHKLIEETTSLA